MTGDWRYRCYNHVLPFAALVTMECINVGVSTLYKAATNQGMSYHVFTAYAYAVAAAVLLPASFFSRRSRVLPPLNISILSKMWLSGIIAYVSVVAACTGVIYSSPTLSSAISNLVPAFTFILAIVFSMETLSFSKKSCLAKLLGTFVSITGALVVTLYRGPILIWGLWSSPSSSSSISLGASQANWVLGGFFLTIQYLLTALWYILLTQIMKEYPSELTMMFSNSLIVSLLSAIVGVFIEPDLTVWSIMPNIYLSSILCSGLLIYCLGDTVNAWALHLKGPLYVSMFKPLSIAIAVAMGFVFLGDDLYLGRVIGVVIISIGFYTVLWGNANEVVTDDQVVNSNSSLMSRSPLLQYYKDENDGENKITVLAKVQDEIDRANV